MTGEAHPAQTSATPDSRPRGGGRRVLVVDDNPDALDSLALLLSLDGHEVRTALDAEQALAIASDFKPDLVVLDIGLPGRNGYDRPAICATSPSPRRSWWRSPAGDRRKTVTAHAAQASINI